MRPPHFHPQFYGPALSVAGLSMMMCTPGIGQELPAPLLARDNDVAGIASPGSSAHDNLAQAPASQPYENYQAGNAIQRGPIAIYLFGSASLVYNDNIYIQETKRQSDLIWTLSPGFALTAGDALEKQESWATLAYSPSAILFTDHRRSDSVEEHLRLATEWRPCEWVLGLAQGYERLSGPVAEAGNRVSRDIYLTNLNASYEYSPKTSLEINAEQSINDYEAPLLGYTSRQLGAWASYWATPKIRLRLGGVGSLLQVVDNPGQRFEQALVSAEYDYSEDLWFVTTFGAEWRQFESPAQDRLNGVFSMTANYWLGQGTGIQFAGFRKDESSLIEAGQNYTVTGLSLNLQRSILSHLSCRLEGAVNHSQYYPTGGNSSSEGDFDYFSLQPGLDLSVSPETTLRAFYEYQNNRSHLGNGFYNNQFGLNLNYRF